MANIIALIIFGGSFIGLFYLIAKKVSILANLPEQSINIEANLSKGLIKQNILQKTDLIKQAVLHNAKMGAIMAKATGSFKTIFANRIATMEDLEKVEKIHKEGDYWQKVETHNFPSKRGISKQSKIEIIQASTVEIKEAESQPKKPRIRKKKAE